MVIIFSYKLWYPVLQDSYGPWNLSELSIWLLFHLNHCSLSQDFPNICPQEHLVCKPRWAKYLYTPIFFPHFNYFGKTDLTSALGFASPWSLFSVRISAIYGTADLQCITGAWTGSSLATAVLQQRSAPSAPPRHPGTAAGSSRSDLLSDPPRARQGYDSATAAPNPAGRRPTHLSACRLPLPPHTGPPPLTPTAVTAAAIPAPALASLPERPKMEAGDSAGEPLPRLRRPLRRGAEPRHPLLPQPPLEGGGTAGGWCRGRGAPAGSGGERSGAEPGCARRAVWQKRPGGERWQAALPPRRERGRGTGPAHGRGEGAPR